MIAKQQYQDQDQNQDKTRSWKRPSSDSSSVQEWDPAQDKDQSPVVFQK